MGGGGGGGQSTTQVRSLDPKLAPYAEATVSEAQNVASTPYQAYGGQRIADFNNFQTGAMDKVAEMEVPGQYGTATGLAGAAATQGGAGTAGQMGLASGMMGSQTGRFTDGGVAASYMNPYVENVLNTRMRLANEQFSGQLNAANAKSVGTGGLGGYRNQLTNAQMRDDHMRNMDDIVSSGLNTAYDKAGTMYGTDEARQLQAAQQRGQLGASLYGTDIEGRKTGLAAAGQLTDIGEKQFGAQGQLADAWNKVGSQIEGKEQAGLTQAYDDWQTQRDYAKDQLGWMTSIIYGNPMATATQTRNTTSGGAGGLGSGLSSAALYGLANKALG